MAVLVAALVPHDNLPCRWNMQSSLLPVFILNVIEHLILKNDLHFTLISQPMLHFAFTSGQVQLVLFYFYIREGSPSAILLPHLGRLTLILFNSTSGQVQSSVSQQKISKDITQYLTILWVEPETSYFHLWLSMYHTKRRLIYLPLHNN